MDISRCFLSKVYWRKTSLHLTEQVNGPPKSPNSFVRCTQSLWWRRRPWHQDESNEARSWIPYCFFFNSSISTWNLSGKLPRALIERLLRQYSDELQSHMVQVFVMLVSKKLQCIAKGIRHTQGEAARSSRQSASGALARNVCYAAPLYLQHFLGK